MYNDIVIILKIFMHDGRVGGDASVPSCRCTQKDLEYLQEMRLLTTTGLEVKKLEFILRLKIKCNEWLLADTGPQAATHCTLV